VAGNYRLYSSSRTFENYYRSPLIFITYVPIRSHCYKSRTGTQRLLYAPVCSDSWMSYRLADIAKLRTGSHTFWNIRTASGSGYHSWCNDPRALDDLGFECQWEWGFAHSSGLALDPTQLPVHWVPLSFLGIKPPRGDVDNPPQSSAQVKERVDVYFYSF